MNTVLEIVAAYSGMGFIGGRFSVRENIEDPGEDDMSNFASWWLGFFLWPILALVLALDAADKTALPGAVKYLFVARHRKSYKKQLAEKKVAELEAELDL